MIDTIFPKSPFSSKNTSSTQYPCGFYDFSKIAFFDHPKKTIFIIAQNGQKAALVPQQNKEAWREENV